MSNPLPESEARELLASNTIGRLGCIVDGEPYVVPINYVFEGDFIYSHSLPGRKIDGLRANPQACLQVDEIVSDMEWRSVIANGVYEEVLLQSERRAFLSKLLASFPKLTPVESVMAHDAAAPDPIVFRLRVDRITGVGEG
jgi:nitroimidazol reductase NimA-like FMN-containing flavoprotein (pyridoxamine 5'-phosphate oxidase superfamily)